MVMAATSFDAFALRRWQELRIMTPGLQDSSS
jgi:hypothetical protein